MKKEINLQNVKGSYDYLPKEQIIRNHIQDTLKSVFESFGYKPLETPILCYYDLLAGKYDETNDLLKEIYKLTDQGERNLGLRYDLTVPFAKCIAMQKDLRLPFKRYEIGKVFRDGPVKTGRDREFLQCDVDVVGLEGHAIEAELINLWLTGFKRLGIEVFIKYNSRNLLRGLIKEVLPDIEEDTIPLFITIIDKMDKITREELLNELFKQGMDKTNGEKLIDYLTCNLDKLENIFSSTTNEDLKQGLVEILELKNILTKLGLDQSCIFSSSLARGQDYYTGNIFEVYAKNNELSCSLGGGGRYDKMITNFIGDGTTYPAVGISFGLSTIFEILKLRDTETNVSLTDLLIVPLNTTSEALKLANDIRALDINVEVDLTGKKIGKSFEYADKENIPFIIILGENEIAEQKFKLKNMATKEEAEISFDNLTVLTKIISH